jgi:hypothetical protein
LLHAVKSVIAAVGSLLTPELRNNHRFEQLIPKRHWEQDGAPPLNVLVLLNIHMTLF